MSATTVPETVARRLVEPEDQPLLRRLFAESRPDFDLVPQPASDALIELQFRAQANHYESAYPQAQHEILVNDGVAVGRLVVDGSGDAVRIVDITIASAYRGRGIGTAVLGALVASPRQVRLSVWSGNAGARRLYTRLGFRPLDTAAAATGYLELQHDPARQEAAT